MPNIRFKLFENDWIETTLHDISLINPSTPVLPENFIYIDLDSVNDGVLTKVKKININEAPCRAQRYLHKGDILFQTVRPYQMNNYYFNLDDTKYVASTGYAQIRSKIYPKFLYYYLHNPRFIKEVLRRCTGTSYPSINSADLKKIKIKIPSSEKEKMMIGNLFANIDQKRISMERKHKLIKKYKNGLMHEIFTQNIKFSNNELCLFKLGEIVELMRNGTKELQVNFKTEFPVTRIETISKGNINFDKVGFVETIDKSYQLKKGDILLSNINSLKYIGNCVYFDTDKILYHGMNLMLIRFKENFNKKFLYYYIKYHKKWFQRMACQAVNQASINQTSLKKFPFVIPKLKTDQDK